MLFRHFRPKRRHRYACFLESSFPSRRISGTVFPLYDEFDGELLYYPEVVPVAIDFGRLLSDSYRNPMHLFQLEPRPFEELIAEIWRKFGYVVELTKQTRDGGRDIIAIKEAEFNARVLIECKRYAAHRRVNVQIVRTLFGVKEDEAATKAILATTSSFTKSAKEMFARHVWELEGRDFDGIVDWLKVATKS